MKVINNHYAPLALEGGVVLAASGTDGSVREVEQISAGDRKRLVDRGLIRVIEESVPRAVASGAPNRKTTKEE